MRGWLMDWPSGKIPAGRHAGLTPSTVAVCAPQKGFLDFFRWLAAPRFHLIFSAQNSKSARLQQKKGRTSHVSEFHRASLDPSRCFWVVPSRHMVANDQSTPRSEPNRVSNYSIYASTGQIHAALSPLTCRLVLIFHEIFSKRAQASREKA